MNKQKVYERLEGELPDYEDCLRIEVSQFLDKSDFAAIKSTELIDVNPIEDYTKRFAGRMILRFSVLTRLEDAAKELQKINENWQLQIVYGYRPMERQQELFQQKMAGFYEISDEEMRRRAVHKYIAIPEAAGHPTGGAVDVQIIDSISKNPLDFGTKIWEFVPDTMAQSPFIDEKARCNRKILRAIMMAQNFAPYDGEWWHFSFGDREWAYYYGRLVAHYDQKTEDQIKLIIND